MAKRRITRWLAPIALIGVVGAVLVVINNSDVGTKSKKDSSAQTISGSSDSPKSKKKKRSHHARTYTVKAGDTLSAIAAKTGVPLDVIEQLNPDIDAQTLHAGQKIKLVAS